MILAVVGQVQHKAFIPDAADPVGMPIDAWADPVPVDSHGWWQPSADEIGIEVARRSQEIIRTLLVPQGTVCGDRDRWTIPGDGDFEQVGGPQDNSHGPFGMDTPLIVYLKTVEG